MPIFTVVTAVFTTVASAFPAVMEVFSYVAAENTNENVVILQKEM